MTLRRRIRAIEHRLDELERDTEVPTSDRFNGDMPPRPIIPSDPVDPHGWWRERCNDYAQVVMVDIDDDHATGMYL